MSIPVKTVQILSSAKSGTIPMTLARGSKLEVKQMAKYKVSFSGFAYVEADNEDEAREALEDGLEIYSEFSLDSVEKVDEFTIRL